MLKGLKTVAIATFAAVTAASPAGAQDITTTRQLSIALASEAAQAALAQCTQQGYRVSVAVYDRSGLLRAYLRGDGASPHSFDSATRKAFTAATFGRTTEALAKRIQIRSPRVSPTFPASWRWAAAPPSRSARTWWAASASPARPAAIRTKPAAMLASPKCRTA